MNILIGFFIFSIVVIFHEFGHFLFAKLSGIKVLEFSLGMGPRLLSHKWGETIYSWKLFPFGGSCMMLGEDDTNEEISEDGSFQSKSVWKRIAVVAGGPLFNFILAFGIALVIIGNIGYDVPVLLAVTENTPAAEAGLQKGDQILSINGKQIHFWREIQNYQSFHPGEIMDIKYERDGKISEVTITPEVNNGSYLIGISGSNNCRQKPGVLQTVKYSCYEVKYWIDTTLSSLKLMVTGRVEKKDISGPVGVIKGVSDTYEETKSSGWYYVWINMMNIGLLLSANLGVMNLIPFPALDGGRLFFLIIEAIRKKRVNPVLEESITLGGFFILMLFMVVVTGSDILKLLGKKKGAYASFFFPKSFLIKISQIRKNRTY